MYVKKKTIKILHSSVEIQKEILTGTPVFPAIPGRPCSPWKPNGPCFPGAPLGPSSPCGPVTPLGPSSPCFPGYKPKILVFNTSGSLSRNKSFSSELLTKGSNTQLKNKLAAKDDAEADSYGASLQDNDSNGRRKQ